MTNLIENLDITKIKQIISEILNVEIMHMDLTAEPLSGGTVASVVKLMTTSLTTDGQRIDFPLVVKTQKKWERFNDPDCWRREYDLLSSSLADYFPAEFRWPKCYDASINEQENEICLIMEYIDGPCGKELDRFALEKAARNLGMFHGKTHMNKEALSKELTNLSSNDYMKNFYHRYRSWPVVFDAIRNAECQIPRPLCEMLIEFDHKSQTFFEHIASLPVVLCHRDYWIANIFLREGKIFAIDWDTAGWGYLGEDIASLIADEADVDHMAENFDLIVSSYLEGFTHYVPLESFDPAIIIDMILAMYGYRIVEWYLFAETDEQKHLQIQALKQIAEIKKRITVKCPLSD